MRLELFSSALWETSSLLLVDGDAALAVDPAIASDEVARIAARAAGLGARVTHVLATHADWDHVCGHAAFPDAVVTMGPLSAERVRDGSVAARIDEAAREHGIVVPGGPRVDVVFDPGAVLELGAFAVETIPLPGHTPDGVGFRVRELDVLAVGDHLSTAEFPFVSSAAAYRATLARLIAVLRDDPPGLVVPGHGPTHAAGEALAVAEADLAYLNALRDAVEGALAAGLCRDGAREAGLAVEPPRACSDDLARMRAANVDAQLAELLPS